VLQVQGVGSFAQRYHVDQPRTQITRKGNSGGDLHRTAGRSLGWGEGGSEPAAQPPSPAGSARPAHQHEPCVREDKLNLNQKDVSLFLEDGESEFAPCTSQLQNWTLREHNSNLHLAHPQALPQVDNQTKIQL
jgi:hypothetical protein